MTLPSRKTLLGNALSLAAIAWIYGGDLSDALRARDAEVAAFPSLPSAVRPGLVLALAALATGAFLVGLVGRRPESFKGYRLLPILLVAALFSDLVLSENRVPLDSADMASMSLQRFQRRAQEVTTTQAVPIDPRLLQPFVTELGAPPYLVRGEPLKEYTLQVRQNCDGPVRDAPGLRPGTLLYCVAPEAKGAWITLVGLPAEVRFGQPAVLSSGGEARFVLVRPGIPEESETDEGSADPFRDMPPGVDTDGGAPGVTRGAP